MKNKSIIWLLILFFTLNIYGQIKTTSFQKLKVAKPEVVSVSSERLNRLNQVFQEYVDNGLCAGLGAIVVRDGKIIYYKAFGYDDIETKSPLKRDVIFRIASQTKAITSVAVMILFEEGKFLLDDPVSKYIPEFKDQVVMDKYKDEDTTFTTIKTKRQVTIRDLLTHTSGIGYPSIGEKMMNAVYSKYGIMSGIGTPNYLLKDQMKKLGSVPLFHQPGEKFTYGINTDLLGYLVEVLSNMSLDEYFKKRIFEPLGMNDTYFYLPKEKQNRLAILYTEDSNKKIIKVKETAQYNPNYPKLNGSYFSGGAGLSSTAYDYAIFMQMILNGGVYDGKRILSRNTVRMMTMNQIGDLLLNKNKFGLGFEVLTDAGSAKLPTPQGSLRWGGIYGSAYWIDPKEKIVAQFFIQKYPNSFADIREKFVALVYQALND